MVTRSRIRVRLLLSSVASSAQELFPVFLAKKHTCERGTMELYTLIQAAFLHLCVRAGDGCRLYSHLPHGLQLQFASNGQLRSVCHSGCCCPGSVFAVDLEIDVRDGLFSGVCSTGSSLLSRCLLAFGVCGVAAQAWACCCCRSASCMMADQILKPKLLLLRAAHLVVVSRQQSRLGRYTCPVKKRFCQKGTITIRVAIVNDSRAVRVPRTRYTYA